MGNSEMYIMPDDTQKWHHDKELFKEQKLKKSFSGLKDRSTLDNLVKSEKCILKIKD